jgi:hypothetical protein
MQVKGALLHTSHPCQFLWFTHPECQTCLLMQTKLRPSLLNRFPEVVWRSIDLSQTPEEASHHHVVTVPTALFLVEGKEWGRWQRVFGIREVLEQIERPYHLYFSPD